MGSKDGRSRASSNRWSPLLSLFVVARNVEPSSWAFFVLCTSTYLSIYSPVNEYIYQSIYMYMYVCTRLYGIRISITEQKKCIYITSPINLSIYASFDQSWDGIPESDPVKRRPKALPSRVCVCVCVYVCTYIHRVETQRERERSLLTIKKQRSLGLQIYPHTQTDIHRVETPGASPRRRKS